jgi:hypothetical protein
MGRRQRICTESLIPTPTDDNSTLHVSRSIFARIAHLAIVRILNLFPGNEASTQQYSFLPQQRNNIDTLADTS